LWNCYNQPPKRESLSVRTEAFFFFGSFFDCITRMAHLMAATASTSWSPKVRGIA